MRFFKALILLAALAFPAIAQNIPVPDCYLQFNLPQANGVVQLDNRGTGCDSFTLIYQVDMNQSGFTLALNYAQTIGVPSSWTTYPAANTQTQSSSFGTAYQGIATYCDLSPCFASGSGASTFSTQWLQIAVSGSSGTGSVQGVLYGYKTGYNGGTGGAGGGGGGSGCPNPCPVTPIGNSTLLSGQQAVTGSAVNLGSHAVKTFCLLADTANTIPVYAGPSGVTTSTGVKLNAGEAWCTSVNNTNLVYVIATTTGANISWGGTN